MKLTAPRVGIALLTVLLAAGLALIHLSDLSVYGSATPQDLVAGIGDLPYQYRLLLPWMVSVLEQTPLPTLLARLLNPLGLEMLSTHFESSPEVTATFLLLEVASILGVLVSFFILSAQFVVGPLRQAAGVALLVTLLSALQALTPGAHLYYPSDTPAVLVVILTYLLLLHGRIAALYSLFIVGTFNRETTLFLIPLLWFLPPSALSTTHDARSVARTLYGPIHSIVLLAIWTVIKLSLFLKFRGNHGFLMHPNLVDNLTALQNPVILATTMVPLLGSIALGMLAYKRSGEPLLRASSFAVTFFLAGMLFAGVLRELRIYAEMTPFIALCILVLATPLKQLRSAHRPQMP